MEKLLTHTFSISNHPIKKLNTPFDLQYVMGIGEFMYYMSDSNNRARLIFDVWAHSILEYVPPKAWAYTLDWNYIKSALCLKRNGFHFFIMRQSFIFDCFYLLSIYDKRLITYTYTFLLDKICGFFTRDVLNETYNHFKNDKYSKNSPKPLLEHQRLDLEFQEKPLKKILVVATMSAGKSTLINALVGHRINRVKTTACTSHLCYLYNKPSEDGIVTVNSNGNFNYSNDPEHYNSDSFTSAGLHFNSTLSSERICLIDTPGTNNSNNLNHGTITKKAIIENDYDTVIFVANSQYFATNDEDELMSFTIKHSKKPIIFVLNQLDRFTKRNDSIQKMVDDFTTLLSDRVKTPIVIPLSAQAALLIKLDKNKLDEDDCFELNLLEKKFANTFYDLEQYTNCQSSNTASNSLIHRSGINLLENAIKTCN